MRKIIIWAVVMAGVVWWLAAPGVIFAQCQCTEWQHEQKCRKEDEYCPAPYEQFVCMPAGCYDEAYCVSNDCNVTCGPGYYVCNRTCCAIGSGGGCQCGVDASGACKPCGGGRECRVGYAVNCASPAQVICEQPAYDFCFRDDFGNPLCGPVQLGNAQRETGWLLRPIKI